MNNNKELWFDARNLSEVDLEKCLPVVFNAFYRGVMIDSSLASIVERFPVNTKVLIDIDNSEELIVRELLEKYENKTIILYSREENWDAYSDLKDVELGAYSSIYDRESMDKCIDLSGKFKSLIIEFKSATNIPLELVLAFSQKNNCFICKEINCADDGWIATMTMEMGSNAVLLKTNSIDDIIELRRKVDQMDKQELKVEALTVKEIKHIAMGDRVCIDTISILDSDEGMIIGSTSEGGILVSSETHFLPYMDLRPFRVNAGAVHSYILCPDNKNRYLSELKAGEMVLVVNSKGESRAVSIGRVKIEKRPMLLIKAVSDSGVEVNTIVQDDWHIRIISEGGSVKNSVLLKEGDKVMGYTMESGRHLGVKIDETIVER